MALLPTDLFQVRISLPVSFTSAHHSGNVSPTLLFFPLPASHAQSHAVLYKFVYANGRRMEETK